MANIKTKVDEWEVKDLEDNSTITVHVSHNTEMGNGSLPGLQVFCMGRFVNHEPVITERRAYAAKKAGTTEYLLADESWMVYEDTYVKHSLLTGNQLKARIEVKVRSRDKAVIKEYELPFSADSF